MRYQRVVLLRASRSLGLLGICMALAGCGAGLFSQTGPSTGAVVKADRSPSVSGIRVKDVDSNIVARLRARDAPKSLADELAASAPAGSIINFGDVIEVSIWESPPAVLFGGGGASETQEARGIALSSAATLPNLLVDRSGVLFVPFAGPVPIVGQTPQDVEREIARRLNGKAHEPQVIVRIVRNSSADVTVVGEVSNSVRMPLTPRGERLLDALAAAGGTRHPVAMATVQLTRGERVVAVPLEQVIRDPRQNVVLAPGDVINIIHQPFSFTALGAAGRNQEVPFEATGLTLAQALGRVGGLLEQRANAKGVFVFRWESPLDGPAEDAAAPGTAVDDRGRIPVIYRFNMVDPGTIFLAQNFPMRNGDVVYIATAPIAEFQQFVNVIASTVLPLAVVRTSLQ